MAVLTNIPVVFCRRCGKPLLGYGMTYDDPLGANVHIVSRVLSENALCKNCKNARLYYISQGRLQDWEAGNA